MGKIYITTNVSTKARAGKPYYKIDNEKRKTIVKNRISYERIGSHTIEIGYEYNPGCEGGIITHYDAIIDTVDAETWYSYKVPFLLFNSRGKMKGVSKIKYHFVSFFRTRFGVPLKYICYTIGSVAAILFFSELFF